MDSIKVVILVMLLEKIIDLCIIMISHFLLLRHIVCSAPNACECIQCVGVYNSWYLL